MKYTNLVSVLALTLAFSFLTGAASAADVDKGEKIFKKCRACHTLADDGKKKTGPHLEAIIGRQVGSIEGFKYSKVFVAARDEGQTWTIELLDEFLAAPKKAFPKTKMSFAGLRKDADRENMIAYLASLNPEDMAMDEGGDPDVSPEILAIEGDIEYGEYLSAGCVGCHQSDGSDQGLPSIVGWPAEAFVTVMHAYKSQHRENAVMQQQALPLSDEEIAALAAYFEQATE